MALPRPYQCALALRLIDQGRSDEANEIFEFLSRLDYADLQRDPTYLINLVQLAEMAHHLAARDRVTELEARLDPYEGGYAVSHTTAVRGAVDRYRGLLAWTRGALDIADDRLQRAIEVEQRLGARPWEALARLDRARLLSERGGASAGVRAEVEAAETACDGLARPGLAGVLGAGRDSL